MFLLKNQSSQRKNIENRKQSQSWLNYAEVHPVWQGLKNSENRNIWPLTPKQSETASTPPLTPLHFLEITVFLVFLISGCSPIGTEGVDAGFACELAHEAKAAGTASETKSQPERRVFMVLVNR